MDNTILICVKIIGLFGSNLWIKVISESISMKFSTNIVFHTSFHFHLSVFVFMKTFRHNAIVSKTNITHITLRFRHNLSRTVKAFSLIQAVNSLREFTAWPLKRRIVLQTVIHYLIVNQRRTDGLLAQKEDIFRQFKLH